VLLLVRPACHDEHPVLNLTFTIQLAAAAVLIFVAIFDRRLRNALESRGVRGLGLISFSLYLVHDPLLVALDYITDNRVLVFVIGVPLSLAIATVFYFAVERPSHRLAQWTSTRIGALRTSAPIQHLAVGNEK
jgi:peptidoglycan/LPS O-acetylase OafA/YrhL